MLKKLLLLSIPLLIPAVLLAALVGYDGRQPAAWQPELEQYLAYQKAPAGASPSVIASRRARHPERFTPQASYRAFGDSGYFRTQAYLPEYATGGRPLPEPPAEIWCVWLATPPQSGQPGPAVQELVFAARYEDLYKDAWVMVAAGPPDLPANRQNLEAIGCDLKP